MCLVMWRLGACTLPHCISSWRPSTAEAAVDVESAKIEPTIPRGTTASLAGNPTILVSRIVLNYIN